MENKIVFVIPDMPGGGTERVVALLANEYAKRNIETAILLFAGNERAYPLDERIEVVNVGNPSDGELGVRLERIKKMRQYYKSNPDCRIWSFSVMGAVFSVVATLGTGKKHTFLISERNDPNRYEHPYIRNFFYRFADVLVCQTQDAISSFPKGIRKKAIVIPNPVDIGDLQPYTGEREKRIVAVGRLEPQKNHKLLLKAFAEFSKKHPEYILDIYGKGEMEKELRIMANELKIDKCVNFVGFSDKVKEEINSAAIYVLSSDYEGISNSMLEAIALGVPVVATDCPIGGSRACIQDGKNGLLVPAGDVVALTEAMEKLADNPELCEQISMEGRKLREKNRIEQIADAFLRAEVQKR
ncbi:MAG: glycosyltransferase family 4 protein [Lachnospiraceae bacterium]|nr:glycosyltransferase family 4 protein [Lachnospiraceae bacterium]